MEALPLSAALALLVLVLAIQCLLSFGLYQLGKMFRREFGVYGALGTLVAIAAALFWWTGSFYFPVFQVFVVLVGVIRQHFLMPRGHS